MRILLVTPHTPWPEHKGAAIRISNAARALGRLGEIDVLIIPDGSWEPPPVVPDDIALGRVERVVAARPPLSRLERFRWLTSGRLPRHFVRRDYGPARQTFHRWRRATAYDVAWLHRIQSYVALAPYVTAPAIVDLDDLEDQKTRAWLALEAAAGTPPPGLRGRVGRRIRRLEAGHDIRLLRNLHGRIAQWAAAVAVCHEADRRRLGAHNAHVIPNSYEWQSAPLGRLGVGSPPVLTLQGQLTYHPNVDGAMYLVREIVPRVRERIPDVQVRVVGDADNQAQSLHAPPRVVVTGRVPSIETELRRADVIVVPVRYGSGSRIKILEALAHRIPVVSTRAGAEGIDVADGRDVLLADTPQDFADACTALLQDGELRRRLTEAGHQVFLAKYRADRVRESIAALALQAADAAAARRRGVPTPAGESAGV